MTSRILKNWNIRFESRGKRLLSWQVWVALVFRQRISVRHPWSAYLKQSALGLIYMLVGRGTTPPPFHLSWHGHSNSRHWAGVWMPRRRNRIRAVTIFFFSVCVGSTSFTNTVHFFISNVFLHTILFLNLLVFWIALCVLSIVGSFQRGIKNGVYFYLPTPLVHPFAPPIATGC